jgi:uncharacterized membrane protein
MCHPLHYLLYRFLPLTLAYDFEILIAYPAMFGGMYLFLRRWSLRRDCSLFGAMLFTFSTFNLTRLIHPNALGIIAHYPWVLYCTDVVARGPQRRGAIASAISLALLNGSELLLGYPQYYWFSALIMSLYGLFLLLTRRLSISRIAMLSAAVVLGVMVGAVQLLPTIDSLALSVRRLSPDWQDDEAAVAGSIMPRYMLQAVSPFSLNVSHKQRIYFGAVPLLLLVWAAMRWRHLAAARSIVAAALVATVLMLWLTLGEHGYLYRLQVFLPGVGSFRYPSRYVHLLSLAVSVCGAFALADLLAVGTQREVPRRWTNLTLIVIGVLSVLVTALSFKQGTIQATEVPLHVIGGTVLLVVAVGLVLLAARGVWPALVALVALAVIDPSYYALGYSVWNEHSNIAARLATMSLPPAEPPVRMMGGPVDEMDNSMMVGRKRLDGFEGLPPYKRLDYRKTAARRIGGVGWVSDVAEPNHGYVGNYAIFDTSDTTALVASPVPHWFYLNDPLPRARLVSEAIVSDDPASAVTQIEIAKTAIVDEAVVLEGGQPGTVEVLVDRPGEIKLRVLAPSRQLLVVSESFHPGWQVQIDAETPKGAVPVNGDFMGSVVEAGEHAVSLVFAPQSFRRGAIVSLVGLLLLALWGGAALFLGRTPSGPIGTGQES